MERKTARKKPIAFMQFLWSRPLSAALSHFRSIIVGKQGVFPR
jgi:hypothetical protein